MSPDYLILTGILVKNWFCMCFFKHRTLAALAGPTSCAAMWLRGSRHWLQSQMAQKCPKQSLIWPIFASCTTKQINHVQHSTSRPHPYGSQIHRCQKTPSEPEAQYLVKFNRPDLTLSLNTTRKKQFAPSLNTNNQGEIVSIKLFAESL